MPFGKRKLTPERSNTWNIFSIKIYFSYTNLQEKHICPSPNVTLDEGYPERNLQVIKDIGVFKF